MSKIPEYIIQYKTIYKPIGYEYKYQVYKKNFFRDDEPVSIWYSDYNQAVNFINDILTKLLKEECE